jgi:large subunit ribosomal protein L4e
MKLQILNKEGKKVKEMDSKLFSDPIRIDIISKVVEAEKIRQPYSNTYRAGMDRSASGNVGHRRHDWKSDRGRGLARIPKKTMWRRGTQFSWEGAIIPSTRGGRRAHPPKGSVDLKKINKKELRKALLSSLSYVSDNKEIEKKYGSLSKVDGTLPLVIEGKVLKLKTREFFDSLKKILDDMYLVAIQKKNVRAGKGKMRGRKYMKNAGLLLIVSDKEYKNVNGIDVVKVSELSVSDMASNGARLTMFSEKAVIDLENVLIKDKQVNSSENKEKMKKVDIRKVRRINRKKKIGSSKKDKTRKSGSSGVGKEKTDNLMDNKNIIDGVKENA